MNNKVLTPFLIVVGLLVMTAGQALAGGPICPPPMCPPPMCGPPAYCPPPMCGPPVCMPMKVRPPRMCPPPCPPPMCGPPPCAPRCDREGPLARLLKGAVRLVAGVVSLPFRVVDRLIGGPCSPQRLGRRHRVMACAPPVCAPMGVYGPWRPMPRYRAPAYGFGMAPGRPVGAGHGAPRRFVPFAKKSVPAGLVASSVDGIFGAYW